MTESEALAISGERANAQQTARWDALQSELAPLRTDIAPDGWTLHPEARLRSGVILYSGLVRSFELKSARTSGPAYTVESVWDTHLSEPHAAARQRIGDLVANHGWNRPVPPKTYGFGEPEQAEIYTEEFVLESPHGTTYTNYVRLPRDDDGLPVDDGTSFVSVQAQSGVYWKESGFDDARDDGFTDTELAQISEATFTSKEWPDLRFTRGLKHTLASKYGH